MKRFFATALFLLALTSSAITQTIRPNLQDFTAVAGAGDTAYLVDNKNVKRSGPVLTISILAARATVEDGKLMVDGDNYFLMDAKADCSTYKLGVFAISGIVDGKPFTPRGKPSGAMTLPAKGSPAYQIVALVCETHVGGLV